MATAEPDLYSTVQALQRRTSSVTLQDVDAVLQRGASPDAWRGPLSPLRYAVQTRHTRLLDLLVRKSANVNLKDPKDVTPLHIATFEGKADCIRILLRARADANATDRHGQTPLFFAPSKQICEMLLTARADANVCNRKQQTPLHMAAHAGIADALFCIADVSDKKIMDVKDHRGHTPLHYAVHSRVKSIALASLRLQRPPSSRDSTRKRVEPLAPVAENQPNSDTTDAARGSQAKAPNAGAGGGPAAARADAATDRNDFASPDSTFQAHEGDADEEVSDAIKRGQWFAAWRKKKRLATTAHLSDGFGSVHGNPLHARTDELPKSILRRLSMPAPEANDGCLYWEVALAKNSGADTYGFVQANGRADFEKRLKLGFVNPDVENRGSGQHVHELEHSPLPGPEVLIVRLVHEGGLMWMWNRIHEEAAIRPQDRIASVNSQRTVETMQNEFRTSDMVVLKMVRYPERFIVILCKEAPADRLGIRFERPAQNCHRRHLRIVEILEGGLVADHNKLQVALENWHYVVMPDMLVETANEASGDASAIANELKLIRSRVVLTIRRAEHAMLLSQ